jgi:hypothetical protein
MFTNIHIHGSLIWSLKTTCISFMFLQALNVVFIHQHQPSCYGNTVHTLVRGGCGLAGEGLEDGEEVDEFLEGLVKGLHGALVHLDARPVVQGHA